MEILKNVGATLKKISDRNTSEKDRVKAQRVLGQQNVQMKKSQEEAVSAQELPDVPLGKAATVCGNAFIRTGKNFVRDVAVKSSGLKGLEEVLVVSELANDTVNLSIQLNDGEYANLPFDTARLVTGIAAEVPGTKLFGTIGTPALYCLQAAWYLDQQAGIRAGTWLRLALQEKQHEHNR
jgi:hypothetical protein